MNHRTTPIPALPLRVPLAAPANTDLRRRHSIVMTRAEMEQRLRELRDAYTAFQALYTARFGPWLEEAP